MGGLAEKLSFWAITGFLGLLGSALVFIAFLAKIIYNLWTGNNELKLIKKLDEVKISVNEKIATEINTVNTKINELATRINNLEKAVESNKRHANKNSEHETHLIEDLLSQNRILINQLTKNDNHK